MNKMNFLEASSKERRRLQATSSFNRSLSTSPVHSACDLHLWLNLPIYQPRFGRWRSGRVTVYEKTFEYELAGTPCEEVVQGGICHHPEQRDTQAFTNDTAI